MHVPPGSLARPLDDESAQARSRQLRLLASPANLRVLSALAARPAEHTPLAALAAGIQLSSSEFTASLSALEEVALVFWDAKGAPQLTAEAWIRFGRLLAGTPSSIAPFPDRPRPPVAGLARVVQDLSDRFASVLSAETVREYVERSYELLVPRVGIDEHLVALTAQFATSRLDALVAATGLRPAAIPEVLFVCVQNAGRSQIAAAVLRHLAGEGVHVRTAGSKPADVVHPSIVSALAEIGVPFASEFPKPLTDEVVQAADFVVTMGCGDACPVYPGRRYMDWPIADPVGRSEDEVREIRDQIVDRVRNLIQTLASPSR